MTNNSTNPLDPDESARLLKEVRRAAPKASLVVYHLDTARVMQLAEGRSLVLGRDADADLCIPDSSVSRKHARFQLTNGTVWVSDLGSTNGTRLNDALVEGRVPMSPGDEVGLGNVTVAIHVRAPLSAPTRGLFSHDHFVSALEEEVVRARTFQRGLAVVMVKSAQGDVIERVRSKLRGVDRLASYGGSVVEVLLPEATAADARALLEPLDGCTWGVATYPHDGVTADSLLEACREAMRLRPLQGGAPPPASQGHEPMFVSPAMVELFDTVERVANAVVPVLIQGETGAGKEVLARLIHQKSPRRKNKLVVINCGAIPTTLVESVLFGHERGAFTGATSANPGVFEEGNGGMVLLDEVGELSLTAQAALLRVLETKQVRRVGASREVPVDVRVIAATHRDLEEMVKAGTFREDLLYRLNAVTLELPPLRERPEEIGPFAERFLAMANEANGRQVQGIDVEAMRLLLRYPWPGNIRELRNAVDHAVVVTRDSHLRPGDLPKRVRDFALSVLQADEPDEPTTPPLAPRDLREGVQRYETQIILEALRATRGNRTEAARRLQIPVRTLSHKIRQYGIKRLGFGLDESDED